LNYFYIFFGAIGIFFRYWVTNIKLKDGLEHRRFHLSRILALLYFVAMALEFDNNMFTLIVVGALPTMVAAFLFYDITFYRNIFRKDWFTRLEIKEEFVSDRIWIFMERITMHIPMIITAIRIYIEGAKDLFLPETNLFTLIAGFIMIYGFYLLVDPRWTQKDEWPAGIIIFWAGVSQTVFIGLYLLL
jgi:hypothetical protein